MSFRGIELALLFHISYSTHPEGGYGRVAERCVMMVGISDRLRDQKCFLGKPSCICCAFGPTRKKGLPPTIKKPGNLDRRIGSADGHMLYLG